MTLVPMTRRLAEVARRVPGGCPTCRGWSGVALCNAEAGEDCHRPEVCPDCRRRVPITGRVVIVGADWRLI